MTPTSLDPIQLRETTDCPACGASVALRPRGVFGQCWMKQCAACGYHKHWRFPKITKKIIYLDQFVISNMVKAKQRIWTELHTKLSTLAGLQLVVCPYSDIHQDESLLSHSLRDELKEMYRSFGGDNHFLATRFIEQSQLLTSIRQWLGASQTEDERPGWCDAFDHDPHYWTSDLQVFANLPAHEPWVTNLRKRKQTLHADLESVCDNWQVEDRRFDRDVERETISYGRMLMKIYRELEGLGLYRFNPYTPPGIQPGVMLVHALAVEAHKARPDESDPLAVVEQFFKSDKASNTPFLYINSRLWATIAQKVRNQKGPRKPKPSDSYDVKAIATYAPYCEAMYVDNEFHSMASQKNVDVSGKFGVRLFSTRTNDAFLAYLDDILKSMSEAHREGLTLLYPHLISILPYLGRQEENP